MPVVEVKWLEGRNAEQKKKLIEGIFRVFAENGVKKESLHVIIQDVPKSNWGMGGKPASEK
ncbi:MAG: 2-hydroxymuconate tautomerase family protein [Candidatus Diapherotrites archaeon]|nr:2-hydroxymuconate tautomerase family protein [Candidatus Diapherotrites archaeon]